MRSRIGPGVLLAGSCALIAGWFTHESFDGSVVLAVIGGLALAAGLVLTASAAGETATRLTGAVLAAAGFAVVVTHHQVWWWLPSSWIAPVTVTASVVAVGGLLTLLLAYGFRRAALSGAAGALAVAGLALTAVPDAGSAELALFRALATCSGAVALIAAITGIDRPGRSRPRRPWLLAAAAGTLVAVGVATFDAARIEMAPAQRTVLIVAALATVFSLVWLATSRAEPARGDKPPAPPKPDPPAASTSTAPSLRARLETLSLVIGVTVGLITIVKEIIAVLRALLT